MAGVPRVADAWLAPHLRRYDVPAAERGAEAAWMPGEEAQFFPDFLEAGGRRDPEDAARPLLCAPPAPAPPTFHYKRPVADGTSLEGLQPCVECGTCAGLCFKDVARRARERKERKERRHTALVLSRPKNQTKTLTTYAWDEGKGRDFDRDFVSLYVTLPPGEAEGLTKDLVECDIQDESLALSVGPCQPDSTTFKLRFQKLAHAVDASQSFWRLNAQQRRITIKLHKRNNTDQWFGVRDGYCSMVDYNTARKRQNEQNGVSPDIIDLGEQRVWEGPPKYDMYAD